MNSINAFSTLESGWLVEDILGISRALVAFLRFETLKREIGVEEEVFTVAAELGYFLDCGEGKVWI